MLSQLEQVTALAKAKHAAIDEEVLLAAFKKRFKATPWDVTHKVQYLVGKISSPGSLGAAKDFGPCESLKHCRCRIC